MPTISAENYLKAIYHLQGEDDRVKTNAIARNLCVTLPSATNMVKSLASAGLVDHQPYRGARLTSDGERAALRVVRKHRLVEAFLVETLGYSWDEVHAEAERLEHAMSDDLTDRIDAYLGHPAADPHGDPIPTASGEVRRPETGTLLELAPGRATKVVRVTDQHPEVLRYLDAQGLRPGADVEVLELLPFDGPVHVRCADGQPMVSRRIARRVLVEGG